MSSLPIPRLPPFNAANSALPISGRCRAEVRRGCRTYFFDREIIFSITNTLKYTTSQIHTLSLNHAYARLQS